MLVERPGERDVEETGPVAASSGAGLSHFGRVVMLTVGFASLLSHVSNQRSGPMSCCDAIQKNVRFDIWEHRLMMMDHETISAWPFNAIRGVTRILYWDRREQASEARHPGSGTERSTESDRIETKISIQTGKGI